MSRIISLHDDSAFEALFLKYWDKVHGLCVRYCRDEDVAKDLTQDIFLSLWQRKKEFSDEESVEKYLAKTAKYRVLAYLRDTKKERSVAAPSEDMGTDAFSPESVLNLKQLANISRMAIQSLPEPSRSIFLLNREQDLTYKQIALQKGLSLKSIEFHISKSLKILREKLGLAHYL